MIIFLSTDHLPNLSNGKKQNASVTFLKSNPHPKIAYQISIAIILKSHDSSARLNGFKRLAHLSL